MEESDLSLQLFAAGWHIYEAGDLRVFHDSDLEHHQAPDMTSGVIEIGWGLGLAQVANKVAYCIRVGRFRGILSGICRIPPECYHHRRYRKPIAWRTLKRFRHSTFSQDRDSVIHEPQVSMRGTDNADRHVCPRSYRILANGSSAPTVALDKWLFFQLGAREHYVLPRSLYERGMLAALYTDAWADPRSSWYPVLKRLSPRLTNRFEPRLKDARVEHFTNSLIWFEARRVLSGNRNPEGWQHIIARNMWFQRRVVKRLVSSRLVAGGRRAAFHAFSYAARDIFAFAKRAGHLTVLQQIDPGLAEEELVGDRYRRHSELALDWTPAPREYWQDWLEECRLADAIVVNSEWSRSGLVAKGMPSRKIVIIPLMYDSAELVRPCNRTFPGRFHESAPLKVLFLGNLCVRKGIAEMLEALDLLRGAPVRFRFVGPSEVRLPGRLRANQNVEWHGAVPRAEVHEFYRQSHVFILPTHSDGFGLTQLEAQTQGVPVIASSNCGEVVRHGENGLLLPEVSGSAIAEAIEAILKEPARLRAMSMRSKQIAGEYSSDRIIPKFVAGVTRVLQETS
jgi:glycosyltransferase involved in cell wall biosynthesis